MRFDTGIDLFFHFVPSNPDLLIAKNYLSRGSIRLSTKLKQYQSFQLPSDEASGTKLLRSRVGGEAEPLETGTHEGASRVPGESCAQVQRLRPRRRRGT